MKMRDRVKESRQRTKLHNPTELLKTDTGYMLQIMFQMLKSMIKGKPPPIQRGDPTATSGPREKKKKGRKRGSKNKKSPLSSQTAAPVTTAGNSESTSQSSGVDTTMTAERVTSFDEVPELSGFEGIWPRSHTVEVLNTTTGATEHLLIGEQASERVDTVTKEVKAGSERETLKRLSGIRAKRSSTDFLRAHDSVPMMLKELLQTNFPKLTLHNLSIPPAAWRTLT